MLKTDEAIAHLHTHSEFSLLDGLRPIETTVELAAKRRGVKSLALTDHGSIAGIPSFYAACSKFGIKPILGVEAYFTPDATIKDKTSRWFSHITILAKNKTGYKNLIGLVTESNRTEHFYYKARVDWRLLGKFAEGLVILTGCPGGILAKGIQAGVGEEVLDRLHDIFGPNLYGEIHYHDLTDFEVDIKIRQLCRAKGIPVVCANDSHYALPSDADIHPLLVAMSVKKRLDDPDAFKIDTRELYLKTFDEMLRDGQRNGGRREEVLAEMEATNKLADGIEDYDISREVVYPLPPRWRGARPYKVLEDLVLGKLYKDNNYGPAYVKRVQDELSIIEKKGFVEYFLVLADLYDWAHKNDIITGPGRGSAAASLVLYLLGVTGIDPMKYPVMSLERFLNEHRIDEPDVDTDWASHQRDQVIEYLENTYGADHVARMSTFSTYAAKALINDMAKALGANIRRVNLDVLPSTWNAYLHDLAAARMDGVEPGVPSDPSLLAFLKEIKARLVELEKKTSYPATRAFYTISGQVRHFGTHAAAVVLSEEPLSEVAPLVQVKKKFVVGYSSSTNRTLYVKTGLLKLDILGVRALETLDTMAKLSGEKIKWDSTDYEDQRVLELYRRGDLTGIFQFESGVGITDFTKSLSPQSFADVFTIMALWRPGPLRTGMSKKYIELGGKSRLIHPFVDKILEGSRGMMVFQEDLIRLYSSVAECTPGEADLFRRDIVKQMTDSGYKRRMQSHKERWHAGCQANSVDNKTANRLWKEMLSFAKYGFNAPHAVCYGAIGFQQMRIKALYPGVFVAASLEAAFDQDRGQELIMEARRLNVNILPPHINVSKQAPVAKDKSVYLHLGAIRGLGEKSAKELVRIRNSGGVFKSIEDFNNRVPGRVINKTVFLRLLRMGSFVGLEGHKDACHLLDVNQALIGNRDSVVDGVGIVLDTGMPAAAVDYINSKKKSTDKLVVTGGILTSKRQHRTKKGDLMGYISFMSVDGHETEAIIWQSMWVKTDALVSLGDMIIVKGYKDDIPNKIKTTLIALIDELGQIVGGVKSR